MKTLENTMKTLENLRNHHEHVRKSFKKHNETLHKPLENLTGMGIKKILLASKKISPCENPNSWWAGTVFLRFNILCATENMLCETQNMLYVNTYRISKIDKQFSWILLMMSRQFFNNADSQRNFSFFSNFRFASRAFPKQWTYSVQTYNMQCVALDVEPCGTWTCHSGTFVWNLVEAGLLRVKPVCGTLWNLNF